MCYSLPTLKSHFREAIFEFRAECDEIRPSFDLSIPDPTENHKEASLALAIQCQAIQVHIVYVFHGSMCGSVVAS